MAIIIDKSYPAKSISYSGARTASQIRYIVVHYTANKTDKAVNNAKYFKSGNTRAAGAHYFVDQGKTVYQSIDDLKIANAVGGARLTNYVETGGASMYKKVTNANSISIELCSTNGKIEDLTVMNAVELVKKLMKKYNIPAKNVYRHFDVTGKACPGWDGWIGKKPLLWEAFKNLIDDSPAPAPSKIYAKVNTSSGLKVRNISGVVLFVMPNNTKVEVLKKDATKMTISGTQYKMTKIKYKGETGYAAQKYLKF